MLPLHRGPDGYGHWQEGPIGFGHRRLSILDPSQSGKQPMSTNDGRYVISYNGEVYNYIDLRRALEKKGYNFKSETDTEVVLNSLAEWGTSSIPKFNGMFAFAVWDRKEKSLILARDRYGIKPLYYCINNDKLLFGSEQKAILSLDYVDKSLNKAALLEYLTFQNLFTDNTLLNKIKILPAGTFCKIDFFSQDRSLNLQSYWDFNFCEPTKPLEEGSYLEELEMLLKRAVKRQLVSDVEIGSYLSGGMDSGAITAIASQELPYIKSFTCGFDLSSASGLELSYDEREKAEAMSALYRSEHYEMVLKAGDMERSLPIVSSHLEEPRVGQSYPNYYASKLASKFVKVVMSGCGGDEILGGYPWRYYSSNKKRTFDEFISEYYTYWQRLVSNREIKLLFSPIWDEVKDVWTRDIFSSVFKAKPDSVETFPDYINLSLYFESKTFLHGLLVVEDKLSMSHGLETRVPFLDNDLVDFSMSCPVNLKVKRPFGHEKVNENNLLKKKRYIRKTNDGKRILRSVMKNFIPDDILNAPKQGFSSPDASWFKGESVDFVQSMLFDQNTKLSEYLNRDCIKSLVSEHTNGTKNRRLLIWSLINLESWMKQNL